MPRVAGRLNSWLLLNEGLQGRDQYRNAVRSGSYVNVKEFAVDLHARLCKVWGEELNDTEPRERRLKRATYHRWFASPLLPLKSDTGPCCVLRYLDLDLGRHVQRNIAKFRLRAHTMSVEANSIVSFSLSKVFFVARCCKSGATTTIIAVSLHVLHMQPSSRTF